MLDSNKNHKEKLMNFLSSINDKNLINSEIPLFYEIILFLIYNFNIFKILSAFNNSWNYK